MLPEIGKKASNFSALDENENTVSLSDFTGKKLVLYFYPKDDTPGCTAEACTTFDIVTGKQIGRASCRERV